MKPTTQPTDTPLFLPFIPEPLDEECFDLSDLVLDHEWAIS